MTTGTSTNATTTLWVYTWHQGPRWVRILDTALMYLCAATRHRGACWLVNEWRVGRWLMERSSTVTREVVE